MPVKVALSSASGSQPFGSAYPLILETIELGLETIELGLSKKTGHLQHTQKARKWQTPQQVFV